MRADRFLYLTGRFPSRNKAAEYLAEGRALVNGRRVKPSFEMNENDVVEIVEEGYLSNGGYKLETAVRAFGLSLTGKTCLDIGASTGGFTDCMLRFGARKVYAVDVGEHQLAPQLAADERVVVRDRTNARQLHPSMFEPLDFIACDVSFISLSLVLPAIFSLFGERTESVVLVKPQFEAGRAYLNKNGVVRDAAVRGEVLVRVAEQVAAAGFWVTDACLAFKRDPAMNSEYVLRLCRPPANGETGCGAEPAGCEAAVSDQSVSRGNAASVGGETAGFGQNASRGNAEPAGPGSPPRKKARPALAAGRARPVSAEELRELARQ